MTNSERINSNNALIDEAIAKANALPDAGSGGGGVETCTVVLNYIGLSSYDYIETKAVVLINDTQTWEATPPNIQSPTLTIQNVVCNTLLTFTSETDFDYIETSVDIFHDFKCGWSAFITANNGDTITINIYVD